MEGLQLAWTKGCSSSAVGLVAPDVICFANGTSLKFIQLASNQEQDFVLPTEMPLTAVATCPSQSLFATANVGLNPSIFIGRYPNLSVEATIPANVGLNPSIFIGRYPNLSVEATIPANVGAGCSDIALSSDGMYLAAVGLPPSSTLTVWNLATQEIVAQAALSDKTPAKVSFNPTDSSQLCTTGLRTASLWTIETCRNTTILSVRDLILPPAQRPPSLLQGKCGEFSDSTTSVPVKSVVAHSWSTSSSSAAPGSTSTTLFIATDRYVAKVNPETNDDIQIQTQIEYSAALTSCGSQLVIAGLNGVVTWTTAANAVQSASLSNAVVSSLCAVNEFTVAARTDRGVVTVNLETKAIATLTSFHTKSVVGVGSVLLANEAFVVSVDIAGNINVWRSDNGALTTSFSLANTTVAQCAINPTLALVAVSNSKDGVVSLLTVGEDNIVRLLRQYSVQKTAPALAFDGQGRYLLAAADGNVFVFDCFAAGRLVGSVQYTGDDVVQLAGSAPASASSQGTAFVLVVRSQGKTSAVTFRLPAAIERAHMDAANPLQLQAKAIQLETSALPDTVGSLAVTDRAVVALSKDGKFIAQATVSGLAGLTFSTSRHAAVGVAAIAQSPLANLVATCGGDCKVRVTAAGDQLQANQSSIGEGHAPSVTPLSRQCAAIAFGANHTSVIAALYDGRISVWKASTKLSPPPLQSNTDIQRSLTSIASSVPVSVQRLAHLTAYLVSGASNTGATSNSATQASNEYTDQQNQLRAKIKQLRDQVMGLITKNESKPDIEKLDREEYTLDVDLQQQLLKERDQAVADTREDIQLQILAQQFLRNVIKQECWDSMDTPSRTLYSIEKPLEVSNFPIAKSSQADLDELKRVTLLRRLEINEAKARKTGYIGRPGTAAAQAASAPPTQAATRPGTAGEPAPQPAADQQAQQRASIAEQGDDADEDETLLYAPSSLTSTAHKRNQIVLLKDAILSLKKKFNAEFLDVWRVKEDEKAKLLERDERIAKIAAELKTQEEPHFIPSHPLERPEQLLEVSDSEVQVARVLTAEEQAAKDLTDRQEAERLAAQAKDNPRERGINDMMGGRLEEDEESYIWVDPPVPEFISAVPKEEWSAEQKKAAAEHDKAMQDLLDLRDKRRKALDSELRKLQETIKESIQSFDKRLQALFDLRIKTEQAIAHEELKILKLSKSLFDTQDSQQQENEIRSEIQRLEKKRSLLEARRDEAQKAVTAVQSEYDSAVASDKALEKGFKTRKDFNNQEPFLEVLFKLYKRRSKKKITAVSDVAPLDKASECPEGLDNAAWLRLIDLRNQKIESEVLVFDKGQELAHVTEFLQHRQAELQACSNQIQALQKQADKLRQERLETNMDFEALLVMKQGQVEIASTSHFEAEMPTAVLLQQALIEDLNSTVKRLGNAKVEHLKQKTQFTKGIHILEWEHRRLDMEKEDLIEMTRDIQLVKTKKNMSEVSVSEEERFRRDIETLNKTTQVNQKAHQRSLDERKRTLQKLKSKISKRGEENDGLNGHVDSLDTEVRERSTIHRVAVTSLGDAGNSDRMQTLKTKRRLKDIVASQAADLAALQDELDRLRLRSFPAFGPRDPRLV